MGGAARKTGNWHGCDHNTPTERPDAGPHENTGPPNPAQHPARPRLPYPPHGPPGVMGATTHARDRNRIFPPAPLAAPTPTQGAPRAAVKILVEISAESVSPRGTGLSPRPSNR